MKHFPFPISSILPIFSGFTLIIIIFILRALIIAAIHFQLTILSFNLLILAAKSTHFFISITFQAIACNLAMVLPSLPSNLSALT